MSVIAIVGFALAAGALSVFLKQYKAEYAMLVSVAAAAAALLMAAGMILPALREIEALAEKSGVNAEYIKVLLKALGICYISELAAGSCRDAGETSLAAKIELACKAAIVILSLPMIKQLIELVMKLT